MEFKNVLYFANINIIGGVESTFYYLAKKYQDYDITILYKTGDIAQIKRLQQFCLCKQYKGEKIKCKKIFFNYSKDIIDNVKAESYEEVIHRDPLAVKEEWKIHPKINKYHGVSQLVCDHFKQLTGKDCELLYNPLVLDKPKKVLKIISATRLTPEKGIDRMKKLGELLDKENIPYLWLIFTNSIDTIQNPNMIFMQPKLDITDYIADADFLVQLSNDESFCYSVVEALSLGTPVIVTDCPVFKEIGVKDGINGWICDFDMSNIDVKKIYNTPLKFSYEPPKDTWGEELVKGKPTYERKNNLNTLQATEDFTYSRFNELKDIIRYNPNENKKGVLYTGDVFDCDDEIMNFLLNKGNGNKANRSLCRVLLFKNS